MFFGSLTVGGTLNLVLINWKKQLAAWISFSFLCLRVLFILLTLRLIEQQAPGFADIDKKEMYQTIGYFMVPSLLLFTISLKIELCLTVPFAVVANHVVIS